MAGSDPADDDVDRQFHIEMVRGEPPTILRLHGELDLLSVRTFDDSILGIDPTCRAVTIDLADVAFIDSTGIGALVRARRELERRLVSVSVVNPSDRARFVFELTGLSDLISSPN